MVSEEVLKGSVYNYWSEGVTGAMNPRRVIDGEPQNYRRRAIVLFLLGVARCLRECIIHPLTVAVLSISPSSGFRLNIYGTAMPKFFGNFRADTHTRAPALINI